jgi:spoIIIJ-associated protein
MLMREDWVVSQPEDGPGVQVAGSGHGERAAGAAPGELTGRDGVNAPEAAWREEEIADSPGAVVDVDTGHAASGLDAAESDAEFADAANRAGSADAAGDQAGDADEPDPPDLELEGEIAADYIEGLLDVADLDGDIDMDVEGDRAVVSVVGATLEELVGSRGEVLDALQELTRLAVLRQTGSRTRMMLDIGGYRQRRRAELTELGNDAADEVKRTGAAKTLDAMNAFERKIVHDAVAEAGLQSESEGAEPDRRVVVLPAL